MITQAQLKALNSGLSAATLAQLESALNRAVVDAQLTTQRRLRYFIAQTYHETGAYAKFSEDMYYTTAQRLVDVWPSRFTTDPLNKAKAYAPDYLRSTEKLANLVYADRYGNGNAASGDGYKFRGRGGVHLTFKNNYMGASLGIFGDDRLVQNPDLVGQIVAGIDTAVWFWNTHNLNALADADEFTKVTKVISGSTDTVAKRLEALKLVKQFF